MKFKKTIFSVLASFLIFNAMAALAENTFPATLKLDDKQWQLGYKAANNQGMIAEYILAPETVQNWTQLVSLQKFFGPYSKEATPKSFAEKEMVALKEKGGYQFTYDITEVNPDETILEFKVQSPVAEQQDEIQRIVRTSNDDRIIFHYVVKKENMSDVERSKWIQILKSLDPKILPAK